MSRKIPKHEHLLVKNKFVSTQKIKIDDIEEEARLIPYRKLLTVSNFYLKAYYLGQQFKNKKIKTILTQTIGEKPTYIDTILLKKSEKNIQEFLFQKGYFDATVTSKINFYGRALLKKNRNRKAFVTYYYTLNEPFRINQVSLNASSRNYDNEANQNLHQSLLKIGEPIDFSLIESERERIYNDFKNHGFFYFNKSLIDFQIDTGGLNHKCNVYINISNPENIIATQQQHIDKVIVNFNFNDGQNNVNKEAYKVSYKGIEYIFNRYNIKPNVIKRSFAIKKDQLYQQDQINLTYLKLINLGLFKSVDFKFEPSNKDTIHLINVYVGLTPSPKRDLIWEPQFITSDQNNAIESNNYRNFGISNSLTLKNKNVFRNAEEFNIRTRIALEKQIRFAEKQNNLNLESANTMELLFPKLIFLKWFDTSQLWSNQKTSININYVYEKNQNFFRNSIPLNFIWQGKFKNKNWFFTPGQVSFNKAKLYNDNIFINLPEDVKNRLLNTFTNYLITGQKLSFSTSNFFKNPKFYYQLKVNLLEQSGGLLNMGYKLLKLDTGPYKKFADVVYFQYIKQEIDYILNKTIKENKHLVFRINAGYGLPYGNSRNLPFEKQFFVGGSNSLRAWRPRILGPGDYFDISTINLDKTGEMMLVTNLEYRFPIVKGSLHGAVFLDAGNIWNITKSFGNQGIFKLNSFYKEMGVNTGLGCRIDLSFFILRFDWGIPIYDPSYTQNNRFVIKEIKNFNSFVTQYTILNTGIGFPF